MASGASIAPLDHTFAFTKNCGLQDLSLSTDPLPATYVFSAAPAPAAPSRTVKRARSHSDVDGEDSQHVQKKKRRLRRHLITSRLSRPYATPTTYILNRGNAKIAQCKQQRAPSHLLRKAAIMNRTRMQLVDSLHEQSGRSVPAITAAMLARAQAYNSRLKTIDQRTLHDQLAHPPIIRPPNIPRPPSPLGISNYEAIDLEGDPYDSGGDDDDEDDDEHRLTAASPPGPVYGDFRQRDPAATDVHEDVNLMDFELGWPSLQLQSSMQILDQLSQGEKQQEVSFAQF